MKRALLLIVLLAAVFVSGCVNNTEINNQTNQTNQSNITFCAQDAMQCPDGSFVGRDPANNCEFRACPANVTTPETPADSLIVNGFDYYKLVPDQAAIDTLLADNKFYSVTFLHEFPVAVMPMTYYFSTDASLDQITTSNMEKQIGYAFQYWENAARGKLKFEKSNTSDADIKITIINNHADEKLTYTDLGSGESTFIQRPGYAIITGGKITAEAFKSAYPARTVMMHQIGHALGFGHSTAQTSIMNENYLPGGDLQQKIGTDTVKVMEILYKDTPSFS